jgi:probable phosphoglycerate mutase
MWYFARHGESTANLSRTFANRDGHFPLTPAGRSQAEALAARAAPLGITRLFASPLTRANETAAIVAERLGLVAEGREELREFDVGKWEGTAGDGGWADCRISDGESCREVIERFRPFAGHLVDLARAGERVLCIGHGGLYRAALPSFFANVNHQFAFAQPFPNTGLVIGELVDGLPMCVEWCGVAPPD